MLHSASYRVSTREETWSISLMVMQRGQESLRGVTTSSRNRSTRPALTLGTYTIISLPGSSTLRSQTVGRDAVIIFVR